MSNTVLLTKQMGGPTQLPRLFKEFFEISVQTTPGAIVTDHIATEVITVPGIGLGDICIGISSNSDLAGITLTAYVSAANTVAIVFANNTFATVTPTAGATVRMIFSRPASLGL